MNFHIIYYQADYYNYEYTTGQTQEHDSDFGFHRGLSYEDALEKVALALSFINFNPELEEWYELHIIPEIPGEAGELLCKKLREEADVVVEKLVLNKLAEDLRRKKELKEAKLKEAEEHVRRHEEWERKQYEELELKYGDKT